MLRRNQYFCASKISNRYMLRRNQHLKSLQFSGGYNEKVTPVPIPNTVVKLLSADDTWMETSRESKSLPDLYQSLMVKP